MIRTLFLLVSFCASGAHANILFEPYAGYGMGNVKIASTTHPDMDERLDASGTVDGFGYGGRLAWTYQRFFIGVDYQGVRGKRKLKDVDENLNWNHTTLYGLVGIQFFNGVRITAAMSVKPHESEVDTSPDQLLLTGTATKFGIGYRYRAPIAVNAEYMMYEFDEMEIGAVKTKTKEHYQKLDYSAFLISLSFPFDIF